MGKKAIVLYGENQAALRKKSEPVRGVNRKVKKLIRDLKDTLLEREEGVGLAAPQINVHSRVMVVKLNSRDDDDQPADPPIGIINPEIIEAGQEEKDYDGCLSFPGLYADTIRPHYLRVKGLDERGKPFDRVFEGFDAILVHHEIDHLDGILFIDRVESHQDLYTVRENEDGELIRVPLSALE